jgi:hypothetical protein
LKQFVARRLNVEVVNRVQFAVALGVRRTTTFPWDRTGVPLYMADRMAVRLGVHPTEIWGDAFYQAA